MHLALRIKLMTLMILSTAIQTYAIDGPITSVESIRLDIANYSDFESIGGSLHAAIPVYRGNKKIMMLASLRGAEIDRDHGSSFDNIGFELGLQYVLSSFSKIDVAGSYDWFSGTGNYSASTIHVRYKQNFLPVNNPVVPFVKITANSQFLEPSFSSPARQDDSYTLLILEAFAGVHIAIREDFRWVIEGGRSQSQAVNNDGPDLADGWLGRIAMQYDWF